MVFYQKVAFYRALFIVCSVRKKNLTVTMSHVVLTNSFLMHPFSIPWKHQKTLWFSDVFRELRKSALGANRFLSDWNGIQPQNHWVHKQALNHLKSEIFNILFLFPRETPGKFQHWHNRANNLTSPKLFVGNSYCEKYCFWFLRKTYQYVI